ncbi:MAG: hypothetical protein IPK59_00715 [Rhodospirillaceae bacterium]|nr:hypothetical protein [Rhodospirillaceae bacterium]
MPWVLVPLLPLLLYSSPVFAGVSLSLPYLFIPIAALLGRRYGSAGFMTVLLGGVLALAPYLETSGGTFGGGIDIYLIGLWVCRATLSTDPVGALIGSNTFWRSPWLFTAVVILLPLSLFFGRHDLQDDIVAEIYFPLLSLFFLALFVQGLAGIRTIWVVGGLAAATLIGILLGIGQLPPAGVVEVRYHLDDLATFAVGLGYFFAGRIVASMDDTRNPWQHPYLTIAGFVLLAVLPQLTWAYLPELPPSAGYVGFYGQHLALPLAALMAGYLLGYGGIGYALVVTIILLAIANAGSLLLAQRGLWVNAEQLIFCVAFGFLGVRLRDVQTGKARAWPGGRWYVYGLLVLLCLPALFSWDELLKFVWPFVAAFGAALLAVCVEWLRRRLKLQDVTLTGEGWLKLAIAIGVLAAIAVNARTLFDGLLGEADALDLPIEIALPAILVILHLPLAYLARVLGEVWPKIADDVRSVARIWRTPPG